MHFIFRHNLINNLRLHNYINGNIIYHRTSLVRWSLHKYKCLWSVEGKGQGSSLQERALHTYTLRLDQSRISLFYQQKKKKKTLFDIFGKIVEFLLSYWLTNLHICSVKHIAYYVICLHTLKGIQGLNGQFHFLCMYVCLENEKLFSPTLYVIRFNEKL